ncbi:hypothetical protein Sjap_022570 [Stephania japonica]|uniref:Uncharacterized protein n=1 Tax=Stephania japonica TaxID=461633 RepID=A0AAP0EWD0_9MAGN
MAIKCVGDDVLRLYGYNVFLYQIWLEENILHPTRISAGQNVRRKSSPHGQFVGTSTSGNRDTIGGLSTLPESRRSYRDSPEKFVTMGAVRTGDSKDKGLAIGDFL